MEKQSQYDRARQHFRFTDKEMDDYESDLTRVEILDYACAFANKETAQLSAENEELKDLTSENASLEALLDECRQCLEMARDGQAHLKGITYDTYVNVLAKIEKIGGVV